MTSHSLKNNNASSGPFGAIPLAAGLTFVLLFFYANRVKVLLDLN